MHGEDDVRPKGGIRGDANRAERLAAELRANLARRKQRARKMAQSRANRDVPNPDSSPQDMD